MILLEIKRGLSRITFKGVLFIASIITIICAFQNSKYISNAEILDIYTYTSIYSASDNFMIFNSSTLANLFVLLMPLLSCVCYADTYFEDYNNGFINFIYTRQKRRIYLRAKYIANFIVGGISIAVPLLINYIILLLRFPNIEPNRILGINTIKSTQLFPDIYYNHPTIYIFLWIFIFFLYSGIFASVGLSLSLITKNRITILFLPFIICNIVGLILEIIGGYKFYPIGFLYVSLNKSFSIIMGEFIIMLIITFLWFRIRGEKNEAC